MVAEQAQAPRKKEMKKMMMMKGKERRSGEKEVLRIKNLPIESCAPVSAAAAASKKFL